VVWVPDSRHEALRDLVRLRAAAKEDEKRAKHRLDKFLLPCSGTVSAPGRIVARGAPCGNEARPSVSAPSAQRTAVKQRPHQETTSCQVAMTEPVVLDHGPEAGRFR
jgi:hypothetical protein